MKKAGIYIRVSTLEQAQHGFSIEEQRERLINHCNAMGWQIVGTYVDPGFSGKERHLREHCLFFRLGNLTNIWRVDI